MAATRIIPLHVNKGKARRIIGLARAIPGESPYIFADGAEKDAEDRVADDKSYGRAGGYFTYIS